MEEQRKQEICDMRSDMRRFSLIRIMVLTVIIALVIFLGGGIALSANSSDTETIRVVMDKNGNMRLLSSEANGSPDTKLRPSEFIVEIISRESVVSLQEMLTNMQEKVSELESRVGALDFYDGGRYCATDRTFELVYGMG